MYGVQVTSGRGGAVSGRGGLTPLSGRGELLWSALSRPAAVSVSKTSSYTLPAAAAVPCMFLL